MRTTTLLPLAAVFTTFTSAKLLQDLTASQLTEQLESEKRMLISFTSNKLEKARNFDATFKSVAENTSTSFATIDCDKELELCQKQDVNSYPTIRYLEKSRDDKEPVVTRYRGPRTQHALESFVRKRDSPILSSVAADELQRFKSADNVVVVAYLREDQTSLLDAFRSVAEHHHLDYIFGYTHDAKSADAEKVSVPSIVLYKNDDGDSKALNGHFTEDDVDAFLESGTKSVIRTFTEKHIDSFMARDKLTTYIFHPAALPTTQLLHTLTPLAKKYEKYITFALTDLSKYAEMAQNFGVKLQADKDGDSSPVLVVHAPMNDNIFRYRQGDDVDAGSMETMLTTILHGKATNGQVFEGRKEAGQARDEL